MQLDPALTRHLIRFVARVVRRFRQHHGLLLASAIAFDSLMSVVPLLGLTLVLLSHILEPEDVRALIAVQLDAMVPDAVEPITRAYSTFLDRRGTAVSLGAITLLIFGTLAFRTIREAVAVIFDTGMTTGRRSFFSLLVPFAYVGFIGAGIFVGTIFMMALDALPAEGLEVFGQRVAPRAALRLVGKTSAFALIVVLYASFYRFLPRNKPTARLALLGGLCAACLWELTRRLLVYYFANISMVGVVYGSLTSVIVLLTTFEVGALVLLLGAQIVSEVLRSRASGLPWYREPKS